MVSTIYLYHQTFWETHKIWNVFAYRMLASKSIAKLFAT